MDSWRTPPASRHRNATVDADDRRALEPGGDAAVQVLLPSDVKLATRLVSSKRATSIANPSARDSRRTEACRRCRTCRPSRLDSIDDVLPRLVLHQGGPVVLAELAQVVACGEQAGRRSLPRPGTRRPGSGRRAFSSCEAADEPRAAAKSQLSIRVGGGVRRGCSRENYGCRDSQESRRPFS